MKLEAGANIRIGIAQIRTDPGRIETNKRRIIESIHSAKEKNVDLLVFPELAIPGYLSRDLFLRRDFIQANRNALMEIAPETVGMTAIIGFADFINPEDKDKFGKDWEQMRFNSAAIISNGEIVGIVDKTHRPNYGVFDEKRYFSDPRAEEQVFDIAGKKVGVQICEDLWQENPDVTENLVKKGAEIVVNLSASPFSIDRYDDRVGLVREKSTEHDITFVYVNRVGSDEHLIFDGQSMIIKNGTLVAKGKAFEEDEIIFSTNSDKSNIVETTMPEEEQIYKALIIGIKDYFRRSGIRKAVIGLSGGIDSAVTAVLATKALGAENVTGITMPSIYSSSGSVSDSEILAHNLGIEFKNIPITDSYQAVLNASKKMIGGDPVDLTSQNIQARIRGNILMAFANEKGAMVINTGNKTELALGYCTLYGDMVGAIAPLGDVNKLRVYALADYINKKSEKEIIPHSTIDKAPSAELTTNQTDENSLGANYQIISPLVDSLLEDTSIEQLSKVYGRGFVEKIWSLINKAEFKRRQSSLVLRVTNKSAFGSDRRYPMSHAF